MNSRIDAEAFASQDLRETIARLLAHWRRYHRLIEKNAPHGEVDREDDAVDGLLERLSILWTETSPHIDPSDDAPLYTIRPFEGGTYMIAGNRFAYMIEPEPQNKRWKVAFPTNEFLPDQYGYARLKRVEYFTHLHIAINRVMQYEREVAVSFVEYP